MVRLVVFMNLNPHGGHALNEVWFVALVAAHYEVSCFSFVQDTTFAM